MKTNQLFRIAAAGALMVGLESQAAFISTGQNPSSPYYADFTANSLNVNYVYDSGTQTGQLRINNPYSGGTQVAKGGSYESSSSSAGTGSLNGGTGYNNASYNGFYSIVADFSVAGTVATLTSGTFEVRGNLLGGSTSDLLLQGSLKTGAGGSAFGYFDPGSSTGNANYDLFQFLFTVTGGASSIVADYFGVNNGRGGMNINAKFDHTSTYTYNNGSTATTADVFPPSNTYQGFDGNWNKNFANPLNAGIADTFVPEPTVYSGIAAFMALAGLAFSRRKSAAISRG